MNLRKITSMTMMLSFVLLIITSVILYIVPHGRVAYWSDWRLWGLTKTEWGNLHINLGFLFLFAGIVHIFYNWKPLLAYMKNKKRELKIFTASFNISLILVVVVTLGTLWGVPPMSSIINLGESIKVASAEKYGEPPYGHAELSSLQLFAKRTGLDLQQAIQLLKKNNITFQGPQQSILDISHQNNLTPKALFEIIKPAMKMAEKENMLPSSPPPGFGNQTLDDICKKYNLNNETIIKALAQKGINADSHLTFKEIATENNTDPHALFEILYQVSQP